MRIGEEIVKYGSAIGIRSWSPRTITRRLVDFVVDQEMRRRYRALTSTAHLALLDALNDSEGAVMLITQDRSLIELMARRPLHPSRSRRLLAQPTANGKEARRVAGAYIGCDVNCLFIPGHAPCIPIWGHPPAIQLPGGRFRLCFSRDRKQVETLECNRHLGSCPLHIEAPLNCPGQQLLADIFQRGRMLKEKKCAHILPYFGTGNFSCLVS